jgi:tetratricopeptide (TPR) repeat protein
MKVAQKLLIVLWILAIITSCQKPMDKLALINQADSLFVSGKFDESKTLVCRYLNEEPQSTKALRLRADCFYELNLRDSMILDLRALANINGATCQERFNANNDIALEYDSRLATDSALKYHRICLLVKKECDLKAIGFTYLCIARLLRRAGEFDHALSAVDSADLFNESRLTTAELRAGIFDDKGEIDSAIIWQTIAIEAQPEFQGDIFDPGWVYLDRANLYQKINNIPAACADWQKAFELGTEEAKVKLDSFCTKTK